MKREEDDPRTGKGTGTPGLPTESASERINKWTERKKPPACSGKATGRQGLGTSVRDNVERDEEEEARGGGGMRVRGLGKILLVTAHHLHLHAPPHPVPRSIPREPSPRDTLGHHLRRCPQQAIAQRFVWEAELAK